MIGRVNRSVNKFPGPGKPTHVYTSELLEPLRCCASLCSGCVKFKPRSPEENCKINSRLYALSCEVSIATLVSRCGEFVAKPRLDRDSEEVGKN